MSDYVVRELLPEDFLEAIELSLKSFGISAFESIESNEKLCFPRNRSEAQVFHSVRAQTHEEISQRQAVWLAIIALLLVVIFQGIDWVIRFLYGI